MLTPLHLIFYLYALIAIGSAMMVIVARNPVRSVLSLVVTFFAMAGIWMILRAEFLSLILILVYVGAVMTLFLFVVMMLNIQQETKRGGFVRYLPYGIAIVVLLTGMLLITVSPEYFGIARVPTPVDEPANFSNIAYLGRLLFTDFAYPFEIGGVILLVAIIAAISLTHRGPVQRKVQRPSEQININPKDRVRLVKMAPTERKLS